jgi:hypothetical protein
VDLLTNKFLLNYQFKNDKNGQINVKNISPFYSEEQGMEFLNNEMKDKLINGSSNLSGIIRNL